MSIVWGPYRVPASSGAVYFLTIVDDYSRALWTYLLLEKSEVQKVLKNFCAYAEKQFNKSVKIMRSDNGTEFTCLKSFFAEKGILHQTSCVATPQQNGRVERKHRHILNVARALLFQANLPVKFWGEAISTATHLINLTPTKVLQGRTPHELLFERKPSYSHLRVFGSVCYVHRNARDKDKFGDRSRQCIFVGYPFGKKGWRVYDENSNEFLVSRDVVFTEDVFPVMKKENMDDTDEGSSEEVDEDWRINPVVNEDTLVASPASISSEATMVDRGSQAESDPSLVDRGSQVESNSRLSSALTPAVDDTVEHTQPTADENSEGRPATKAKETSASPVTEESAEVETNVELGRGQREKHVPAKFKDYTLYNARCDPHHTLIESPSESTAVPGNNTPYPLENYINDI